MASDWPVIPGECCCNRVEYDFRTGRFTDIDQPLCPIHDEQPGTAFDEDDYRSQLIDEGLL